jgi:hypothetical protein
MGIGANAFLDVAIGLVFLYLTLSITCTVVNEIIATFFGLRARTLESGIKQLLDDPALYAAFYDHGLIDGTKQVSTPNRDSKPHPPYFPGQAVAMALLGALDPTRQLAGFADVEQAIRKLPDSNIRDVLLAHVQAADKDMASLRLGLANWFDHSMDRLSDDYKRQLRLCSFVVGLGLACLFNVDTVDVTDTLWHDGTVRQQMVSAAAQEVATQRAAAAASAAAGTGPVRTVGEALQQVEAKLRPMPLGWNQTHVQEWTAGLVPFFSKIVGLLMTALALSLGAPFWFDVLSKFMQVRGTGAKPPRSDPQA